MAQTSQPKVDPMNAVLHLNRDSFADDEMGRLEALNKARALCQRLETPWEALVRQIWLEPSISVAVKISQDIGLFTCLAQHKNKEGQSVDELAQVTASDPRFLRRILRLLASTRFIEETRTGKYRGTTLSESYSTPGFVGGMTHMFTQVLPVSQGLPQFMSKTKYANPEISTDGPFQYGLNTSESFFQWLQSHPVEGQGFNELMSAFHEQAPQSWLNVYPTTELTQGVETKPDIPLVIDVGGGVGKDMENLRQALLPENHRLLVQDLDMVVQQGKQHIHESIEFQVHDFFQEQPVHGARAYFMQSILHDWPDPQACQILRMLRPAMTQGYSKLLLCENILPERAPRPLIGAMDIVMMGLLCSKERTEAEWRELLSMAGFRIVKIWGPGGATQCIIEAEPIQSAKM